MHTEISRPRKGSVTNGLSVYSSDSTRLDVYTQFVNSLKLYKEECLTDGLSLKQASLKKE